MKGLADVKWTEALTAAVACAAPAVAWLTFWTTHREKLAVMRQHRRDELDLLRGAVAAIRPWAQTVYTDNSHDPAWYNASFMVLPLPLDAERFRELTASGEFPEGVNSSVVRLEAAVRRFHEMLNQQIEFLRNAPHDIALRWSAVVAAAEAKGGPLMDEELPPSADYRWLLELYRRNKAIHVDGIGGPNGNGLHEALRLAASEMDPARERLSQATREPWWMRWGHGLAAAFVLAGVILLAAFYGSLVGMAFHRVFPTGPAGLAASEQLARRPLASTLDTTKARLPSAGESSSVKPREGGGVHESAGNKPPLGSR